MTRWGSLYKPLVHSLESKVSWTGCHRLVRVARVFAEKKCAHLNEILKASNDELAPLHDPLQMELGLHRWLAGDREEAYSDWLQWILKELATPERIAWLLYRSAIPQELLKVTERCTVDREVWVPKGHANRTGKLDIVVRFGSDAIIVIEVKVVGAESADTLKQAGYSAWLQKERSAWKDAVLIASSGEALKDYEKFRLL